MQKITQQQTPTPNVGATLAVALNAHTHTQGANTATENANINAQGDREGRPYAPHPTVAKPTILATAFVIMQINIVETDNYPSLRNNNLTTGGSL
jgi:hypothetical protein